MRKPYPFKVPVDTDDPNVAVKVMVDMPMPINLTVHLANEHGRGSRLLLAEDRAVAHMREHMLGQFREGAEHYHNEGEHA